MTDEFSHETGPAFLENVPPCPFCSSERIRLASRPVKHVKVAGRESYVYCVECGAEGPSVRGTHPPDRDARAVAKWSTRPRYAEGANLPRMPIATINEPVLAREAFARAANAFKKTPR